MKSYVVKEKEGKLYYVDSKIIDKLSSLKIITHPIRNKILKILAKNPTYPAELAKELEMDEQKIYYHINQMTEAGLLEVIEKKEIRGTTAKILRPKNINYSFVLSDDWKNIQNLFEEKETKIKQFLTPFIKDHEFNSKIVVGSPDPHGPHKARARDGHYAIDLALFLGGHCTVSEHFSTNLDVDVDFKDSKNLVLVGGPVTNLLVAKINESLPAKFSDKKPWGIISDRKTYTEESVGMICRVPNPYNPENNVLVIAGIRFIGTKSAVLALTRFSDQIAEKFNNQEKFFSIVQGFDIDGDGKIDSIEVLE